MLIGGMSQGLIILAVALVAFVGSHFLLSHTLRRQAIDGFGLTGFRVVYSIIAIVLLLVMFVAYHLSPHGPALWSSNNPALQIAFAAIGYFAVALFVASLFGNPGLVGANLNGLSTRQPDGVYKITRHPMMFSIAIWCVILVMVEPSARNAISCGGLVVLAVVGARLQDAKNSALSGREWTLWASRTPFWPDLRRVGRLGIVWLVAAVPWLIATWLVTRLTFAPVGVWYFLPDLPY